MWGPIFLGDRVGMSWDNGIKVNPFYSDISHKNLSRVGSWERERGKMKIAEGCGFSKWYFPQAGGLWRICLLQEWETLSRGQQSSLYPSDSLQNLLCCWTLAPPQGQITVAFPWAHQKGNTKDSWAQGVSRKSSDNPWIKSMQAIQRHEQ